MSKLADGSKPEIDLSANPDWKLGTEHCKLNTSVAWTFHTSLYWERKPGVLFSNMNYTISPAAAGYGRGIELRIMDDGLLELRIADRWPAYAIRLRSEKPFLSHCWQQVTVVHEDKEGSKAQSFHLYLEGEELAVQVLADGLSGKLGEQPVLMGHTSGKEPERLNASIRDLWVWQKALSAKDIVVFADKQQVATLAEASSQRLESLAQRYDPTSRNVAERIFQLRSERVKLIHSFPTVMVMHELAEVRPTHVLKRGVYDSLGEPVSAQVPEETLSPWPEGAPKNRLGLAQWLTHPQHPLTARVVVNRVWQQIFGLGLVKTSEDFGFQSEYPQHLGFPYDH